MSAGQEGQWPRIGPAAYTGRHGVVLLSPPDRAGDRSLALALAFAAAAILILAGIALWAHGGWWRATAVVGPSVSTFLMLVYFIPR